MIANLTDDELVAEAPTVHRAFGDEMDGAIGLAVEVADVSGATDSAASAMLEDVLGAGADGFEQPFVHTAPRLPEHFVDQDHDGLG